MPLPRSYLLFLTGGAIISGWAGSLLPTRSEPRTNLPGSNQHGATTASLPDRSKSREPERDFAALIRDLVAESPKNPENALHFPAWEKIRGFSLEQVRDGLQIAGDPLQSDPVNIVACMLLSRWGELDPQAALASLSDRKGDMKQLLVPNLIGTWMQRDPEAAVRWAQDHPGEIEATRLDRIRAATILQKPPADALAEARGLPAEARRQVVILLAQSLAGSVEKRERCFRLLEGMDEADRVQAAETMASAANRQSPRDALELLETLPMTAEARAKAQSKSLLAYAREKPAEAIAWLDAHPGAGSGKDRGIAFNSWNSADPEAADAWLERQSQPAPLLEAALDQAKLYVLSGYANTGERPRQGERLRAYFIRWQALDPAASALWLEKAAPDVVSFITPAVPDGE
ncbi:hypothetical protein [Luteolibacter sp. Populi]|uniref:hypothetical protein n=1 Tax=Luteolibacter sp. Populi TaxID=3230487 RepID=UPI003465928E